MRPPPFQGGPPRPGAPPPFFRPPGMPGMPPPGMAPPGVSTFPTPCLPSKIWRGSLLHRSVAASSIPAMHTAHRYGRHSTAV